MQIFDLAVDGIEEQLHEAADLDRRPLPVLAGEREQREGADLTARALLHAQAHRPYAFLVTGVAWQTARFGPAPVAVHDDCDVLRNTQRALP